jgi:hypothetical protein
MNASRSSYWSGFPDTLPVHEPGEHLARSNAM